MPSKRKQAINAKHTRGRKKIVLFLVEGRSDSRALSIPLANTCYGFDRDVDVYVRYSKETSRTTGDIIEGGDVTSKYGVNPDTIELVIDRLYLLSFFRDEHLYPKDITRIIQLVDMDGAFIPDSNVIASNSSNGTEYTDDLLLASDTDALLERNAQKRDNICHLVSMDTIKTGFDRRKRAIPYSVYFFSSNLDHFLHDDANLEQYQKIVRADDFSRKCCSQPSLFYDTILSDSEYVQCSYAESWKKIQVGCNSLKKHSNLGLLLTEMEMGRWDQ